MIGYGIMFAGLLFGALSGSISIMLIVVSIGILLTGANALLKYTEEQQAQAWRKQYPSYRY